MQVMAAGAIPVILADGWRLPFDEVIDWITISVRIPEEGWPSLIERLHGITIEQACVMREKVIEAFDHYFSTFRAQFDGLLEQLSQTILTPQEMCRHRSSSS